MLIKLLFLSLYVLCAAAEQVRISLYEQVDESLPSQTSRAEIIYDTISQTAETKWAARLSSIEGNLYKLGLLDESGKSVNGGFISQAARKLLDSSDGSQNIHEEVKIHLDKQGKPWKVDYGISTGSNSPTVIMVPYQLNGPSVSLKKRIVARPATADGEEVPEPEKTFLQKYWQYLVPIVLVMLLTGGGSEEKAKQ